MSPLAGKPAPPSILVNVARLVRAYYTRHPDPFGASAPLKELQKKFGFEPERIAEIARALVARPTPAKETR